MKKADIPDLPRLTPKGPFTNLKPRDQEIGQFYVVQECLTTDFKAPKV